MQPKHKNPKPHHILVAIITTGGTIPGEGFDEVPQNQPIKVRLEHASKELAITNTDGWIATIAGRELNTAQNYVENGLEGNVEINWGPREGGGGCIR